MSTETVRPLYLWNAMPHHLEALKTAKAAIATDIKVQPVGATPELHDRVLAFRERPPFACENYFVSKPEMMNAALRWAMRLTDDGDQGYAEWLVENMGIIGIKGVVDESTNS